MPTLNQRILSKIYEDLKNERKHLLFYLTNAGSITGLLSEEYSELFLESSKEELEHVNEFQNLIVGCGGNLAESYSSPIFEIHTDVKEALKAARNYEEEVVDNYASRILELENSDDIDLSTKSWLIIFYEDQLKKSRADVDKYNKLLK